MKKMTRRELLTFHQWDRVELGRTHETWQIRLSRTNAVLGIVKWSRKRGAYCFYPGGNFDWTVEMLAELSRFLMRAGRQDEGAHSRACGIRDHAHGTACARDCPTCGNSVW